MYYPVNNNNMNNMSSPPPSERSASDAAGCVSPPASLGGGSPRPGQNGLVRQEALMDGICKYSDDGRARRVAQFYGLQLQQAYMRIDRLECELSRLRDGTNLQVGRAQDENARLRTSLEKVQNDLAIARAEKTQLLVEKSGLENRLDILQLRLEMLQYRPIVNAGMGPPASRFHDNLHPPSDYPSIPIAAGHLPFHARQDGLLPTRPSAPPTNHANAPNS